MILKQTIIGSKFAIEGSEQAQQLTLDIHMSVCGSSQLLTNIVQCAVEAILIQNIDNPGRLSANLDTIIDVYRWEEVGQQGREEGHMLRLMGRGTGDQSQS